MKEQLIDYWKSARKNIRILTEEEKAEIWRQVKEKYLRPGVHIGYSICDALNGSLASSNRGPDSWRCIGDFIKKNTVILFLTRIGEVIFTRSRMEVCMLSFMMRSVEE